MSNWVSVADAAACQRVSVRTIQRWITAGHITRRPDGRVNQLEVEAERERIRKKVRSPRLRLHGMSSIL